jgi:DNA-binding winged helix-turn-helix (wHTH) protein
MSEIAIIPRLEITFGPRKGEFVAVEKTPWLMGRDTSCDYPVENERLSRQHVQIASQGGRWFVTDLQSTNGTYLNGHKLLANEEKALTDGDEIQLGKIIVFRFSDPSKTTSETYSQVMTPGLWLNVETGEVFVQMQVVSPPFSARQFALLQKLSQNSGKIFKKEQIIETLWPSDNPQGITDQAIDAEIYRIKERLRALDAEHDYIQSVRGLGKKFVQRD